MRFAALLIAVVLSSSSALADDKKATVASTEARYLANIKRVTFGLPRAGEGYFSPDGKQIVYQAYPVGYPFYQIYTQPLNRPKSASSKTSKRVAGKRKPIQPRRISPGRGRTTCAYFTPDGKKILFASAHTDPHLDITELKARQEAAKGGRRKYQWAFDPYMDIYVCNFDGTGMKRLTKSEGYDAEGSYSSDGKQIVFTSTRDGDPDIYIMDADGKNVRQITDVDGYDGGPFFSPDNKWIIFRSDRQKEHMLQLFAVSVDGKKTVQLTKNLNQVNWCPYFHPSGKYLIWSGADYSRGPRGAHFQLYTMEISTTPTSFKGGKVTQITYSAKADVLPVFSPDGKKLMWTSTRSEDGSSQLFIADWLREKK